MRQLCEGDIGEVEDEQVLSNAFKPSDVGGIPLFAISSPVGLQFLFFRDWQNPQSDHSESKSVLSFLKIIFLRLKKD